MTWLTSIDQMGNKVELNGPPQRIISLVPSQTELLYDLGLEDRVIGITKFCVHPGHWLKSKAMIGGTKNFHLEKIRDLKPDLIIGNKEENHIEGITELQKEFPVWMSDVVNWDDALSMIKSISQLTDCEVNGTSLTYLIQKEFLEIRHQPGTKTLYLMWHNPWMGAGRMTFIDDMMRRIGLINVLSDTSRYPELSPALLAELNPTLVLLSSEPFPFSTKHIPEILKILPKANVQLVDGEMFSWYGSRLALAPRYFNSLKFG